MIRFYWLASEDIKWSNDVIKSVEYASESSWTFGPFDSGLNQKFDLPNSHLVDLSVFKAKDLEGEDPSSLLDTDSPQALEESEMTQSEHIKTQTFPLVIVLEAIGSGNFIQF
jgi:hypothetical protein